VKFISIVQKPVMYSVNPNSVFEGKVKVKVNMSLFLTKYHILKTCWGSGGRAPHILNLSNRIEASGQLYAPAALPPG
jgi:hypothetical protein